MPHAWAALTTSGHPAAVAGFERWGADIVQMGVAADPDWRSRGYASAAAGKAMSAALDEWLGRAMAWSCRVGNKASERLAARLGFTELGRQAAVPLAASDG